MKLTIEFDNVSSELSWNQMIKNEGVYKSTSPANKEFLFIVNYSGFCVGINTMGNFIFNPVGLGWDDTNNKYIKIADSIRINTVK